MDRDSYWQEIVDLVKHHKQNSAPVEKLPEEQMEQLESSVYAHIDQLYSDSEVMPAYENSDVLTTTDLQKNRPLEKGNKLWAWLFQDRSVSILVMTTFALFSVGILVFLLSDKHVSEPLYDIPESVVAADVEPYIQIPQLSLRALAGAVPSERRRAFLAGVAQADLDLIGDVETPSAHQIAIRYYQITTNTTAIDAPSALKAVQASVSRFSTNEQTSLWLKQGYALEVVHLAAKRSMVDLNTQALIDALQFYRMQTLMPEASRNEPISPEIQSSQADISRQYIHNHGKLVVASPAQLTTPGQLQEIVDMTQNMKVLIQ